MVRCVNCGLVNPDESRKCVMCGTDLNAYELYEKFKADRILIESSFFDVENEFKPKEDSIIHGLIEGYNKPLGNISNILFQSFEINQDLINLYNQGVTYLHNGDYQEALRIFDRVLEEDPKYVDALTNKGAIYKRIGNYEEALDIFCKVLDINYDDELGWANIGDILLETEHYEAAIIYYNKSLYFNEDHTYSETHKRIALMELGRYDEAYYIPFLPQIARDYYIPKIQRLMNEGKHEEALEYYDKALKFDNDYLFWGSKGETLTLLSRYEEALDCYNKSLEIQVDEDVLFNKALLLRDLGRAEESIDTFNKLIELNPEDDVAWYCKGKILNDLGEYEDALECYNKSQTINPESEYTLFNKGLTLINLNRPRESLYNFNQALKINPESIQILFNKAHVLIELEKLIDARTCFEKIIELDPENEIALERLLDLSYLEKIDYDEMINFCDRILKINPDNKRVSNFKDFINNIQFKSDEEIINFCNKALEEGIINPLIVNIKLNSLNKLNKDSEYLKEQNEDEIKESLDFKIESLNLKMKEFYELIKDNPQLLEELNEILKLINEGNTSEKEIIERFRIFNINQLMKMLEIWGELNTLPKPKQKEIASEIINNLISHIKQEDKIINLLKSGKREEALELINKKLGKNPTALNLTYKISILYDLKRYDELKEMLNKLVEPTSQNYNLLFETLSALIETKCYEPITFCCEHLLKILPEDSENYIVIKHLLSQIEESVKTQNRKKQEKLEELISKTNNLIINKNYEEALKLIDKGLKINHSSKALLFNKLLVLKELNKYEEMLEICDKLPEDLDALTLKINALHELKRDDEVIDWTKKFIELSKNNENIPQELIPELEERLKEFEIGNFIIKGIKLEKEGNYEEALKTYEEILKIDPNNSDIIGQKGSVLEKLERHEEALEYFSKEIELNPGNYKAWNNKGNILRKLGKCEESLKYFNKAIEINPDGHIFHNKGLALKELGKQEESLKCHNKALDCFNKVLEINPHDGQILYDKGILLFQLEKHEETLDCINKVLEINPHNYNALELKIGLLIALKKQDEELLETCNKILKINPNDGMMWILKTNSLISLFKYKEAEECIEKALSIIHEDDENYKLLLIELELLKSNLQKK